MTKTRYKGIKDLGYINKIYSLLHTNRHDPEWTTSASR